MARDISARKDFEREIQQAKIAAEQAKVLAEEAKAVAEKASKAKDHFLSVLSHELRTPLTPVLAALSIIEHDPAVPAHIIEHLHMIRRNVETEARIVDDLLDITRIANGKIRLHQEVVNTHAAL